MRGLFSQNSPLGCAFGRDSFQLAGRRSDDAGGELKLHEGRLTLDPTNHLLEIESSSAAIKSAIRAIGVSRRNGLLPARTQNAILSVPNHLLMFRSIRLAPMPDAELLSATHWKITEETGLDPQESTSQIVTAWPVEEAGKPKTEVLAVVVKNEDLQPYLDVAENTGLTISAIDLTNSAICRSLGRTSPATTGMSVRADQLLLVLEEDLATLTIASGAEVRYMRILQAGLARLGQLVNQLSGVSSGEAHAAATNLASVAPPPPASGASAPADFLTQAMSIYSRELSREISLAVRYYEETFHAGAPDRGVIVAARGFLASFAGSLSNLTSIQFQAADIPPEAPKSSLSDSPAQDLGSTWHVPIGLCLYDQHDAGSPRAANGAVLEVQCAR